MELCGLLALANVFGLQDLRVHLIDIENALIRIDTRRGAMNKFLMPWLKCISLIGMSVTRNTQLPTFLQRARKSYSGQKAFVFAETCWNWGHYCIELEVKTIGVLRQCVIKVLDENKVTFIWSSRLQAAHFTLIFRCSPKVNLRPDSQRTMFLRLSDTNEKTFITIRSSFFSPQIRFSVHHPLCLWLFSFPFSVNTCPSPSLFPHKSDETRCENRGVKKTLNSKVVLQAMKILQKENSNHSPLCDRKRWKVYAKRIEFRENSHLTVLWGIKLIIFSRWAVCFWGPFTAGGLKDLQETRKSTHEGH